MTRHALLILALASLTSLVVTAQEPKSKPEENSRTLKIKLSYTGTGTVDSSHKIFVFLFDSPDFQQGGVMPIASKGATNKTETVTISGLSAGTVYAVAVYDPTGGYDGESGPPPTGASMGMYSKTPGTPEPVKLESGKSVEIGLTFDDTVKMQ